MRNGYKVYDSDTHIRPGADTLEKYLSSRVRGRARPGSRKVPHRRHATGLEYTPPYPRSFRLRSGDVGGWGRRAHAGRGGATRHNAWSL